MAESTKEATEEGAKVTTVAEGADATAAPPAEDKKSMLMALGIPEEVADAAIASDGDGFKDGASRVSMFYSLKVNDDAKAEWKDHYLDYTKGAKASKGHVNVSHSYNEGTKEVICSRASVPSSSGSGWTPPDAIAATATLLRRHRDDYGQGCDEQPHRQLPAALRPDARLWRKRRRPWSHRFPLLNVTLHRLS